MKSPGAHRSKLILTHLSIAVQTGIVLPVIPDGVNIDIDLLRVVNQNAAASETVHDVAQECNLEQFGYVQS